MVYSRRSDHVRGQSGSPRSRVQSHLSTPRHRAGRRRPVARKPGHLARRFSRPAEHREPTGLAACPRRRGTRAAASPAVRLCDTRRTIRARGADGHGRLEPRARGLASGGGRGARVPALRDGGYGEPGRRLQNPGRAGAHAVCRGEQVRHDDRACVARRRGQASRVGTRRLERARRRDHRSRYRPPSRGAARRVPGGVRQSIRHRRPLLRAVVFRHGAGGLDGRRPRRPGGLGASNGAGMPVAGRGRQSRSGARSARRGGRRGRARQADAPPAPGLCLLRVVGRATRRGKHGKARRRHRAGHR